MGTGARMVHNSQSGCTMQVILNRTRNTYDSEPQWNQCLDFQSQFRNYASSWAPTDKLLDVGNDTLYISGAYTHSTRIVDLVINDTGAHLGWPACLIAGVLLMENRLRQRGSSFQSRAEQQY